MTDKTKHTWELDEGIRSLDQVLDGARKGIRQSLRAADGTFSITFTRATEPSADIEPPKLTPEEYEDAFDRPHPDAETGC